MRYPLIVRCAAAAIGIATATTSFAQYVPVPSFDIDQAEQAAGRQLFANHCAACHTQKQGSRMYGPSLAGIVGRPAASLKGFPYSAALKKSGVTWTEENLRTWIADSAQMIPNTLMPHVSIRDPAEQIYLIAYLKTLKARAAR